MNTLARLTSLAVVASATALSAQGQATPVSPMSVVATRAPESPKNIAASIEVITGKQLRDRGATSLQDALALAAGVAIAPGGDGGPASAVPEFWGLREFDAFLLVVDGIPWGGALNPAIATASLRDVERIEILRGPAPVTYGATSFVGVIHIVHSAAAAKAKYLEGHGGSFGSGGLSIDLPTRSFGSYDSRLSADLDRQGFKDDNTGFSRAHALWRLGTTKNNQNRWFTTDVNVLMQQPASPHPREGPALSTAVPLDANHNPDDAHMDETRVALSAGWDRPVMKDVTWGTMASYTFSHQDLFRGFLTDISDSPNNAAGFKEEITVNDLYVDTHLIWPERNKVRVMMGADLLMAFGEGEGATFTYTAPLNGATRTKVTEPTTLDKDSEDERRFLGAYGSVEWRPATRLTLNGGLRLNATSEKRGEGAEVTHSKVSGGAGAIASLWEKGSDFLKAFANVRSTFKPAAFDFGLVENEGVLDPETSLSYEGGLKIGAMNGRVDAEVSAFQMDFENLVTSTIVSGSPTLVNGGTTRFKGVELAADVRLEHSLVARATYSMHDGKFVDFVQEFGGTPTQLGGKRFEMSAKKLASAGLVYAPDKGLIAHASMNYTGDRYLNKRNTALVPSFSTIDAGVGYRMNRYELRLDGRNLGDKRDAVSESEFGDAQYYRTPARSVRASVLVRY